MKYFITILLVVYFLPPCMYSQEIPAATEQQLENLSDTEQGETEDDAYLQDLDHFRKNPINLNTAEPEELKQLRMLSDLQIGNLMAYRSLFGKFISIYELQAIPTWDITMIKKLLPFVTVANPIVLREEMGTRFRNGEHSVLLRISQVLESAAGFNASVPGTKYIGSPQRIFLRYRYNYKNLLQFGLVGDKDGGEPFLKGEQRYGFDFYSIHLFARQIGIVQAIALGDFSVSMGQGLIQWQGLAFKKSVEVMGVKRQSATLRPYSSAGEFYFHRGAGITIRKGRWESTAFVSLRKLDGNIAADSAGADEFVSSFITSGYHRTFAENAHRNKLAQTCVGANIIYRDNKWHIGINGVFYKFSLPVQKRDEPYNLYAINGDRWQNYSLDYSYTYKNFHVFGEAAMDMNRGKALVNGILLSVDPRVDISFVQRTVSSSYQSINGNAFTENSYPTNELGFYTGITIRPVDGWRIDMYGDIYKFSWLRYLADAPGDGKDLLMQLTYTPNRQVELYTRFRNESKQINQPDNTTTTNSTVSIPRQSWRTQVSYKLNSSFALRNRVELLWYDHKGVNRESGFLSFVDIIYKPLLSPYSGVLRFQYFETGGYNSRIYAYENDVLYSYSIPPFSDTGFRYYMSLHYDLTKKIACWLRWAQVIYRYRESVGPGTDEIQGNTRTEVKLQLRWLF